MHDFENAIEITNLTKCYDGFKLDKVSFSVPKGCVMGFIGQNGARSKYKYKVKKNQCR